MIHHRMSREAMINWLMLDAFSGNTGDELVTQLFLDPFECELADHVIHLNRLIDLDSDALYAHFTTRVEARADEAAKQRVAEEASLFINLPGAFADGRFWARHLVWTLEEGVALSLGRDPKVLNTTYLLDFSDEVNGASVIQEFHARCRLAESWEARGQLSQYPTPGEFMAWLERANLTYPPELREAWEALGHQVADWKTLYEEAETERESLELSVLEYKRYSERLERELGQILTDQPLQTSTASSQDGDVEPFDPRARTSLEIMLYAVAAQKYRFDPDAQQWPATAKIVSAVALEGLTISDKAVRGHLRRAALTARKLRK